MRKCKKAGIILILVGFCLLIISFAFISGHQQKLGVLESMSDMELILNEGKWIAYPRGYTPPAAPLPAPVPPDDHFYERYKELEKIYITPLQNFTPHYENRIAIPYKYFFGLDIILIFLGIGIVTLSKSNKKSAVQA